MMKKLIDRYCQLLSVLMVVCMGLMVVMVFTNVVLRYVFNSGINMSEEMSRWLFVWMTFLGAVVAMRDRGHLGTDMLVAHLSLTGKKVVLAIAYALMLYCCWLVFEGALAQTKINMTTTSAVTELPMAWFYGCGVVFAVSGAVILLHNFWRLVSGQMSEEELVGFQESEESPHNT